MKKKKKFCNHLNIEVTGPDLWRQFWKNQNFCFMVLKAQVRTFELRSHEKKKDFPIPLDIEVTGPDLLRQFQKKKNYRP